LFYFELISFVDENYGIYRQTDIVFKNVSEAISHAIVLLV